MTRLAIVGPIHPLRGGIAQHTLGLRTEALSRGHDVRVYSYRRQYPGLLFPGRTQLDVEAPPVEATHGVSAPIDSLWPPSWWRTGSEVEAGRPDVVALQRWHPFFAPPLATIARRARGTARIAWMVHNARPHEDRVPWGPLLRLGILPEDVCLVHAAAEEGALRSLGVDAQVRLLPMPAPHEVVRANPEEARVRLGLDPGDVVFLFFGHVRAYKGVDTLLDALALLPSDGPPWRAVVAGEWYVDRRAADDRLARAPLAGRVRIDDRFVPDAATRDYFAASTAVVLPYRSGTQSAVVPLAYAHGRPVVTTRVGGLPEIVADGETGRLVPPDDAPALAAALDEIRRGRRFSPDAVERARARASFAPLVDALEAIVRPSLFP